MKRLETSVSGRSSRVAAVMMSSLARRETVTAHRKVRRVVVKRDTSCSQSSKEPAGHSVNLGLACAMQTEKTLG